MGKTVYCISNGSPDMFPNNTLTAFGNKFPFLFDYGRESNVYKLQVAVDAIGFSLQFNQNFLSKNKDEPTIIIEYQTSTKSNSKCYKLSNNQINECDYNINNIDKLLDEKNKTSNILYSYHYIYLDNSIINVKTFCDIFKKFDDLFKLECDDGQNTITLQHKNNNVIVQFNTSLLPYLKVSTRYREHPGSKQLQNYLHKLNSIHEQLKRATKIGSGYYHFFRCETKYDIHLDLTELLSLNHPKLIKVKCKNIRDQIFNNSHEKDLIVFCPQIDKSNDRSYFFHEFETRTYCTLENTILDQITFDIHNEFNEPLHLDVGIPTILKLDIIAMEKYKKAFNIRVASMQDNRSNFTVKLPQNLHFNENWQVCLSSINLPNTFNTFNTDEDLIITFYYQKHLLLRGGGRGSYRPTLFLELVLKNKIYTKTELLAAINMFFKKNPEQIDIGELVEYTPPGQKETKLKLIQNHYGNLKIPLPLVEMFGDVERTKHVIDDDGRMDFTHVHPISGETRYEEPIFYEFINPFNINYFKPNYIMLYADIIKPVVVSGIYMNVMKIFPTSPLNIPYVIQEFKNVDYLSLNNYDISEISIQLRNHAGDLISFDSNNLNPVILNLHFTNYST